MKEKIKTLIAENQLTIYELSQKADLSEGCIRNWFTKRNYTPSLEAIEKLAKAFDLEPFELLCDRDDVFAATEENRSFLESFNKMSPKQKTALLALLESYSE